MQGLASPLSSLQLLQLCLEPISVSTPSHTPGLAVITYSLPPVIPLDSISHLASVRLKSTLFLLLLKYTDLLMAWPQLTAVAPLYSLCTDLDSGFEDQALRKLRLSRYLPALSGPLTTLLSHDLKRCSSQCGPQTSSISTSRELPTDVGLQAPAGQRD